jgi:superfamily II DNA helicase RecQ
VESLFRRHFINRRRLLLLAASFGMVAAVGWSQAALAIDANEDRLIQQLIGEVENLKQGTFIRNGLSYDAEKAASHLRDKLAYFKNDIHTADDFIRLCATRSEMTGIRYKLKDGSGVPVDAAEWLYTKLAKMRSAQQGEHAPEHQAEAAATK